MGIPSRSLNWAMDLRALVIAGFCPVIAVRSRTAPSMILESHVHHDLGETGDLHDVGVLELLLQRRDDLLAILLLQAWDLDVVAHQISFPVLEAIRTLR